jgi:cyclic dehypoxanthinyl futalosine synthase
MLETPVRTDSMRFEAIAEKVLAGERLSFEDGVALFRYPNLPALGALAHAVRMRKNPHLYVTYVIGRIINYTNVCWVRCKFCAFYRPPNHAEGYLLSDEEILQKIDELVRQGGVEALIQGGLNPKLKIDYYERLFRLIKQHYPQVIIHGLSPTEILYIAHISRLTVRECLQRLVAAGTELHPGRGRRDSGGSRAPANRPLQGHRAGVAGLHARGAPAGAAQHGEHDVRACGDD